MKNYVSEIATDLLGDSIINPGWPENSRPVDWITKIVVHHEAQFAPSVYDNDSRYRAEAEYQNNTSIPGSKGIQYHYHIDNVGLINQLRPLDMLLWHCGDFPVNQHSIAICVDGDFEAGHQTPTREQFESLKQLLDWLSTQHPEFPAIQSDVYPHRAFFATNCPGDNLVGWVDNYRTSSGTVAIPDVPYQHPELQPSVPPVAAPMPPAPAPVEPASPAPADPSPQTPPVLPDPVTLPAPEAAHQAASVPAELPPVNNTAPAGSPVNVQPIPPAMPPETPLHTSDTSQPPLNDTNNTGVTMLKPGWQTSEFYVTLLTLSLPIVNRWLNTTLSTDQITAFLSSAVAVLVAGWAAVTYVRGRIHLKGLQ